MADGNTKPGMILKGTQIEVLNPWLPKCPKPFALFDFDGTISLIREGWQQVMIPMMVDILRQYMRREETEEDISGLVTEFVTVLTGKQTIYQMMAFEDEVHKRGGEALSAGDYKDMYLEHLWERIKDRVEGLKNGTLRPEDYVVPGALELLENLHRRGVQLFIASGTDQPNVIDEATALGVAHYANGQIYGATEDLLNCSKAMVIEQLLRENHLQGSDLLGAGDGFVEIEETKKVGGVAIGVAVDEQNPTGPVDEWKRERLGGVGADIIIPNFLEQETLLAYLWGEL